MQHLPAGAGVQGAGGLIRQNDGGLSGQGPGNGHPLLLAAGELTGQVAALIRQPHPLQGPDGPLMPLLARHTGIEQRQFHILLHGQLGNEVILLENESQHPVADLGLLVVVHGGYIHPAQMIGS